VVNTQNNGGYSYDKLVIATGADPFVPSIPGKDLPGVFTFKTEDDLRAVMQAVEELIKTGVELILQSKVTSLKGERFVEEVQLEKGQSVHFDGIENCSVGSSQEELAGIVVFAVGMRLNVDLFRDTALEIDRDGIVVNERMETSIPDVYAVGDCVQYGIPVKDLLSFSYSAQPYQSFFPAHNLIVKAAEEIAGKL
jgi:NAD(P)H-nitrite reductase large subunit